MVPDEFASAKQMEVQVEDLLPAVFTVVGDESVTGLVKPKFFGDLLDERGHLCHHLSFDGLKVLYMFFGDDKHMNGCFGVEVVKGQEVFTFMDGIVGDLPVDDLTENTHSNVLVVVLWGQL
jgi:hypothetical protein